MELRQLDYLVAVAEDASFTVAARRLHVAQPGISAQIRKLERELGTDLLDRTGRRVRPTAAGTAVLPYARSALAGVAGVRQVLDELTGLARGQVTFGTLPSISPDDVDLAHLLAEFHRDHPGVAISLTEAASDQLVAELAAGRIDVALAGLPGRAPPGIETQVVTDTALVAAVPEEDVLAGRATVTLRALMARPLICLPPGNGLRAVVDGACARAGLRPHVAFEASDPRLLAQLARRGLGVAILPAALVEAGIPGLRALTITRPRLRGRLHLAWRATGHTSPAARALIAHTRVWLADAEDRPDGGES